jgi:hypothetical protein
MLAVVEVVAMESPTEVLVVRVAVELVAGVITVARGERV